MMFISGAGGCRVGLAVVVVALAGIAPAAAHSYLCEPTSRSDQCSPTRGELTGPCDARVADAVTPPVEIGRGDTVALRWPRNNHPGGLIRLAWAPTALSDDPEEFDARVQSYSCHEAPCNEQNQCDNRLDADCVPCARDIEVPTELPDGEWTLQWVWYGGGYGLNPYYSCVDYVVSGGAAKSANEPTEMSPVFSPGDHTYPAGPMCWLSASSDNTFPDNSGPSLDTLLGWSDGSSLGDGAVLDGVDGLIAAGDNAPSRCDASWEAPPTSGFGWWQLDVSVSTPETQNRWAVSWQISPGSSISSCWGDLDTVALLDGSTIEVSGQGVGTSASFSCGVSQGAHQTIVEPSQIETNGVVCSHPGSTTDFDSAGSQTGSGDSGSTSSLRGSGEGSSGSIGSSGGGSGALEFESTQGSVDAPNTVDASCEPVVDVHECPEGHTGMLCPSPCSTTFFQCVNGYAYPLQAVAPATKCFGGQLVHEYNCEVPQCSTDIPEPATTESSTGSNDSAGVLGSSSGQSGSGSTAGSEPVVTDPTGPTGSNSGSGTDAIGSEDAHGNNNGDHGPGSVGSHGGSGADGDGSFTGSHGASESGSGSASTPGPASASGSSNGGSQGADPTIDVEGNGGTATGQACPADGNYCWPSNCCAQMYTCSAGVAYPPTSTASGTVCYGGSMVHANDPRCENVICGEGIDGDTSQSSPPIPDYPVEQCGDGRCEGSESCSSCASDCGVCEAEDTCGNNICDAVESCVSCASDCGPCGDQVGHVDIPSDLSPAGGKRVVAYYTNWAQYRSVGGGSYQFLPEHIDATLLTHIVYAFAKVAPSPSFELEPYEWNDIRTDMPQHGMYNRFHQHVRSQNPSIRTLIAVGGWNFNAFDSTKSIFGDMASTPESRSRFVASAIQFCRSNGFDGLSMDWEYPAVVGQGGQPRDKTNFALLLEDLRSGFEAEAVQTGNRRLVLSAAVAAGEGTVMVAYDVPRVAAAVDWIDLMAYDLHGSWEAQVGAHTALYAPEGATVGSESSKLTVDYAVRLWLQLGCPPSKLVMGMASYGRAWTLQSAAPMQSIGAAAKGAAVAGTYTREPGFLSWYEIERLQAAGASTVFDDSTQTYYSQLADQWVGYDAPESIDVKVDYMLANNLGGAMLWALDLDDFSGGRYPVLRSISERTFAAVSAELNVTVAFTEAPSRRLGATAASWPTQAAVRDALSEALAVSPRRLRLSAMTVSGSSHTHDVVVNAQVQVLESRALSASEVVSRMETAGGTGTPITAGMTVVSVQRAHGEASGSNNGEPAPPQTAAPATAERSNQLHTIAVAILGGGGVLAALVLAVALVRRTRISARRPPGTRDHQAEAAGRVATGMDDKDASDALAIQVSKVLAQPPGSRTVTL